MKAQPCFYCGRYPREFPTTLSWARDHLTPKCRGGLDVPENIVPACKSCNSRKGTKTLEEFRYYMRFRARGGPSFKIEQLRWLEAQGFGADYPPVIFPGELHGPDL